MGSHGYSRNKLPSTLLRKKRARGRIAQTRMLRLELLEDRTAPTVSPLASIAVQLPPSRLEPLPASLLGPQGLDVSGSLESLLGQVLGSGSSAPDAVAASPVSPSFDTPLVNNPNEDVNLPNPQDTQNETSVLAIPGANGAPPHIVTAFNDTGSFNPFAQFPLSLENKLTGYSVSTDGGTSFTDEGALPTNLNGDLGDPTLARDDITGTVYLTTLPFAQLINGPGLSVFRSSDGGAHFSLPYNAAPGLNVSDIVDKPWSTVDNFPGPGRGNVYEVFTDDGQSQRIMLTRSTDGGLTWGPSGGKLIADAGIGDANGAYVTVGPDHAVYVFWLEQVNGTNTHNLIMMAKSTDQGVTFGAPIIVATLATTKPGGDLGLIGLNGRPFRTNAFPQAVVNPTNPKDIYLVFDDAGTKPGDKADIYFMQSSDGGSTWSARIRVNNDSTTNDQWEPSLAVTPDGTHLGVFWYDRRSDPKDFLINRFGAIADLRQGGAVTFPTNFAYNQVAFPPVNGLDPVASPTYMSDYDQTTADNQFFYSAWGDNRLPSTAHPGNQADVRFAKIPVNGPITTPANVLANNPIQPPLNNISDTQSETALVVVPGPTPTIVSAFNDSSSFGFYASSSPNNHFTGFSQSTNGGESFTDKGKLPASPMGDGGDPVLARDDVSGKIYLSVVPFAPLVSAVAALEVFPSSNNGASFGQPVNSAPGFSPFDFLDKPWIAVDNAAGKGQGNVYQAFTDISTTDGGIYLTRSTDGGATWGPSGGTKITGADFINRSVGGADVVVGPDHAVYVFYLLQNLFSGAARIVMQKSTDFGVTFGPPIAVAVLRVTGVNGDLGLTDSIGRSFRTNAFPQAAVNPVTGAIYVVYDDVGTAPGDKADIYFRQSTDGGTTWDPAIRVNDDKTTNDQWQPALAVTPDGKHVGVFWYDRRLDPANNLIDRFGAIATVNGSTVTFGENVRVTTHSFVPVFGQDPLVASNYMGDYDQVAADNRFFYTTWGDNSLPSKGHAGFNADVRFAKIRVDIGSDALQSVTAAAQMPEFSILQAVTSDPVSPVTGAMEISSEATTGPRQSTPLPAASDEATGVGSNRWPRTSARRLARAKNSASGDLALVVLDDVFASDPGD
jgi:hypothetical protein